VAFNDSLHWHSGSQVEDLSDSETELTVCSLGLESFITHLVFVDNLPSLSWCSVLFPDLDVVGFFISSSCNIEYLGVLDVGEEGAIVLEDLPPVRVGAPELHVAGSS
jgi:hypothetical protein